MCPHTTVCVSSYCYIRVLILLYVSSYCYVCVLILLCMCPHTALCVLILPYMCPHTTMCVLILLCVSSDHYICPLLYMCSAALLQLCCSSVSTTCVFRPLCTSSTIYVFSRPVAALSLLHVSSDQYICVPILLPPSANTYTQVLSAYTPMCVFACFYVYLLIPLYVCHHTTIYVSSYYYICVLLLLLLPSSSFVFFSSTVTQEWGSKRSKVSKTSTSLMPRFPSYTSSLKPHTLVA
jgi:hypothetical protein